MNWRDIIERSVWTFIQGFASGLAVIPVLTDESGWKTALAAGTVGGLSALLSFLKTTAQEALGAFDTRAWRQT